MQIKEVLVPTDFSPRSRLALDHGIAFARKFQARLTLLHVMDRVSSGKIIEAHGDLRPEHICLEP